MNAKKVLGAVLVVALLGVSSKSVSAAQGNENAITDESVLWQKVMEEYQNDEQFLNNLEEDPESAMQMIENAVEKEMNLLLMPMAGDQAVAYCTVPDIWQKPNQCGAASAYQAIAGAGGAGNIAGSSVEAKVETLWKEVRDDGQNSSVVWKITRSLNSYVPGGNYTYKEGGVIGQSAFELYTAQSLLANHPVILHAITTNIDYYNKHYSRHYICVSGINRNTGIVTVVDCNNNESYHGTHTMSVTEAYGSITEEAARYLIYG